MDYNNNFYLIVNKDGHQSLKIGLGENQLINLLSNLLCTKLHDIVKFDELDLLLNILNIDQNVEFNQSRSEALEKIGLSDRWKKWSFLNVENFLIIDIAENFRLTNILESTGQCSKNRISNDSDWWYDKNGVRITDFDNNQSLIIAKSNSFFIDGNQTNIHYFKFSNNYLFPILNDWRKFVRNYESCQIPGIIPESKLDTFIAVQKQYIKDEWWKKY